jgi:alanine-glyoxylate transaminase / serine-glyoxylate transaminase / serine-pyruvate transaminase
VSPDRYSDSVTAVLMPEGCNGDALRKTVRERFNVSLGGGLGKFGGKIFRIGHLGDLNEPMLLGALSAIEMAMRIDGIPHGRGGVEAAMAFLAEA